MSRGLGSTQRRIVAEIDASASVTPIELAWKVAFEAGDLPLLGPNLAPDIELPRKVYVSVVRAAAQLRDRGFVIEHRKLDTLDALVRHLPFRTRSLRLLQARQRLLPALVSYIREHGPAFSGAQSEDFLFTNIDEPTKATLRERWVVVDRELSHVDAGVSDTQRDLLLELRARGAALFRNANISAGRSFVTLARETVKELEVSAPGATQALRGFCNDVFPRQAARHATMKGQLYAAVDLRRDHAVSLKDAAKEALLRATPDIVRGLPRHRDRPGRSASELRTGVTTFDPLLDRLVDRKALQAFVFVRRATTAAA